MGKQEEDNLVVNDNFRSDTVLITPKAFANSSPGFELARTLGTVTQKAF